MKYKTLKKVRYPITPIVMDLVRDLDTEERWALVQDLKDAIEQISAVSSTVVQESTQRDYRFGDKIREIRRNQPNDYVESNVITLNLV